MKTILHLSAALMLIAGGAGTLDFLRLFRTGEIERIYTKETHPKPQTVEKALAKQAESSKEDMPAAEMAPVMQVATVRAVATVVTPPVEEVAEAETALLTEETVIVSQRENGATLQAPVTANTESPVRRKLDLRKFSRAMPLEEELLLHVEDEPVDTTTETFNDLE